MGFPRLKYWCGLPFPSPRALPDPGIEPTSLASPALAGGPGKSPKGYQGTLRSITSEESERVLWKAIRILTKKERESACFSVTSLKILRETWMVRKYKKTEEICKYKADSLCHIAETNVTV